MNTPSRTYKTVFRASVVASATTLAALSLASPASAAGFDSDVGVGTCTGTPPQKCGNALHLPFTQDANTNMEFTFTKNPNPCPDFALFADVDGNPVTVGVELPLAAGAHTLNLDAAGQGCQQFTSWGGHATVQEFKHTGQPKPAEGAQPLQGPTVSPNPGALGVTFHITDRSGVASQCTYSSEGFTSNSFALPANGSFDLFVPAIREFRNRTGTVTCDNGTSAGTSVQF